MSAFPARFKGLRCCCRTISRRGRIRCDGRVNDRALLARAERRVSGAAPDHTAGDLDCPHIGLLHELDEIAGATTHVDVAPWGRIRFL